MPLSDIVNVVITRQTQSITERGFGIPLIVGANNNFNDLIRFYSSMDEVALDFAPSQREYIAAQDIFAQTISPNLIAIGRRQVNNITLSVETAMSDEDYIITVNGNELIVNSTSTTTYAVATLNGDLVPGNIITLQVNGNPVSVTSTVTFSADFVTGNSIVPTVNGTALTAVPFNTDQATTLADVAARIETAVGVSSAVIIGPRQLAVTFIDANANVINSVITTGGASQPTATMAQVGFLFDTDSATTMNNIASAISQLAGVASAEVSGGTDRILTLVGPPNTTVTLGNFIVTGGASQATATITNPLQPASIDSIAQDIANAIHSEAIAPDSTYPIDATAPGNGIVSITNRYPGVPYTLTYNTSIIDPNRARVVVTQVEPSTNYTISINNIDFRYRSSVNIQSANEIVTALVDMINLDNQTLGVTATNNNDGSLTLEADNNVNTFSVTSSPETVVIQQGLRLISATPANPIATDLSAINGADSSWYGLILTDRTQATVVSAAAWVEANKKLFGTASSDPQIINVPAGTDQSSIAAVLGQAGYVRTFVMYHQDADYDYPEAAWMGAVFPLVPGSETWKFKTLNRISYSNLTTTQSRTALAKKANTYEFVGGIGITQNGTVAQGEYIDTIRGVDWLTARIEEYVFGVLVRNPKVPYTDAGIAGIQAEVMRVLSLGITNDFLADTPAPICTVPRAADVPPADKAARILRNVRFQATLAGAIHAVEIRGTVSV